MCGSKSKYIENVFKKRVFRSIKQITVFEIIFFLQPIDNGVQMQPFCNYIQ